MYAASPLPLSASVAENRRHAPKNSCLAGPPRGVPLRRCRVGRQEARQRTAAQAVRNQLAGGPGRRSHLGARRSATIAINDKLTDMSVEAIAKRNQRAFTRLRRAAQDQPRETRESRPAQLRPVRARDQGPPRARRASSPTATPRAHSTVRSCSPSSPRSCRSRRSRTTTTGSRGSTRPASSSTSGSCC